MENQHRKIKGYRELTQEEIDLMNEIKELGPKIEAVVKKVIEFNGGLIEKLAPADGEAPSAEYEAVVLAHPHHWADLGADHLQQGLMALTRAVAKPTFF